MMSTTRAKSSSGRVRTVRRKLATEEYTDERVAEFLLSNTTDAEDYARAVKLVRKMGLDPQRIDHDKPVGVR